MRNKKKSAAGAARINTAGTAIFHERTKNNSKKNKLQSALKSGKESRAADGFYHLIVLPDKPDYYVEDMNDHDERNEAYEWWAENTVEFLEEIQGIYAAVTEENEEWLDICSSARTNRKLGYPNGVTYMWKVSRKTPPEVVPVNEYIEYIFAWCDSQFENEQIFPEDEETDFPDNFYNHLSKMFSRLFRVFHIIFSNKCLLTRLGHDQSLELCLRHFLYFGWKWQLLTANETNVMKTRVARFRKKFDKDQKLYLAGKLPLVQVEEE